MIRTYNSHQDVLNVDLGKLVFTESPEMDCRAAGVRNQPYPLPLIDTVDPWITTTQSACGMPQPAKTSFFSKFLPDVQPRILDIRVDYRVRE